MGFLPDGMEIRRILQICPLVLNIAPTADLNLHPCNLTHPGIEKRHQTDLHTRSPLMRQVQRRLRNVAGAVDAKLEIIRLLQLEEESFFYFSPGGGDITSWTQRKFSPAYWTGCPLSSELKEPLLNARRYPRQPVWRRADDRFFWNSNLLSEALKDADRILEAQNFPNYGEAFLSDENWKQFEPMLSDMEGLLSPIVQGYVEIQLLRLGESLIPCSTSHVEPHRLKVSVTPGAGPSESSSTGMSVSFSTAASATSESDTEEHGTVIIHGLTEGGKTPPTEALAREQSSLYSEYPQSYLINDGALESQTDVTNSTTATPSLRSPSHVPPSDVLTVVLFSRRSRRRAGTRYRRRGIDGDGQVANYVETEQLLHTRATGSPQTVAFLQIRGSVPLFWSQTSLKYRPPINLEKGDAENQAAFAKHWTELLASFQRVVIINLLDCGRRRSENPLFEAYIRHLLLLNRPNITCVLFDFHDYCRGLRFENASMLLSGTMHLLKEMKFCWATPQGLLCEQSWIFRLNCLDCLDRTNLVQCMFAGVVMATQLKKFGLLGPEDNLPTEFMRIMQRMWANNGDAISQQYAGTVAMKGDYTRTGGRTVNGVMRDGVSSMNRYYLRFRELARQAAIDLLLGNDASPELTLICDGAGLEAASIQAREKTLKTLISRCRKLVVDPTQITLSECLLITYSDTDLPVRSRRPRYVRIPVCSVQKLELGLEPSLFRARRYVLRIFYSPPQPDCYASDSATPSTHTNAEPTSHSAERTTVDTGSSASPPKTSIMSDVEWPTADFVPKQQKMHSSSSDADNPHDVGSPCSAEAQVMLPTESIADSNLSSRSRQMKPVDTSIEPSRDPIRLTRPGSAAQYYLAFLQPNIRLFNTVLVPVPPGEENFHALHVVAAMILAAVRSGGRDMEVTEYPSRVKLNRLRQANVPVSYQPPLDADSLFSGLKLIDSQRGGRRGSSRTGEDKGKSMITPHADKGMTYKTSTDGTLPEIRLRMPGRSLALNQFETTSSSSVPSSRSAGYAYQVEKTPGGATTEGVQKTYKQSNPFFEELARLVRNPIGLREQTGRSEQQRQQLASTRTGPVLHELSGRRTVNSKLFLDSATVSISNKCRVDVNEEDAQLSDERTKMLSESDTDVPYDANQFDGVENSETETTEDEDDADDEEDVEIGPMDQESTLFMCALDKYTKIAYETQNQAFNSGLNVVNVDDSWETNGASSPTTKNDDALGIDPESNERTLTQQVSKGLTISTGQLRRRLQTQFPATTDRVLFAFNPISRRLCKSENNLQKSGESFALAFLTSCRIPNERTLSNLELGELCSKQDMVDNHPTTPITKCFRCPSEHTLLKTENMPTITLTNTKTTERLRKKRVDTMIRLDELRREVCPKQKVLTSFIVF
ncbi:phosphatidylinositol 4-phosphatase [Paragonimus westermani]|uniref:Phosphatidylinositol 4-phosphatase n=1 Tax=Paragonimus westermani TaxID=34504 RepID=A0A5J4P3A0_9TREM|nr:phosphatidylinositol 4-phosphatase [Paragonimus westermani]